MIKKSLSISKRAQLTQFSPIRKFVPLLEEIQKRGVEVFELQIGQPDMPTPKEILKEIRSFNNQTLAYTPSPGIFQTRLAWQKYYQRVGIKLDIADIVITTGGSEAILFAFAAVADPQEEIIVFEPFYSNYNGYASMLGVNLVPLRTFAETGFHLPKAKIIEKAISKKTKGILICNPNNPTGTVYSKKELAMIANIAKKHNLFILADETYREFVYDNEKHFSMMDFSSIKDRVILMDSVSKRFNACGARIGCLASKNKQVIEAVVKFAQARLSSPTIEQLAVIPLLNNSAKYTSKLAIEYRKRRDIVFKAIEKMPEVLSIRPKGAFYAVLKLPIKDSDHFTKWLLTEFADNNKTLLVAPGSGFYASQGLGHDEVRLAFVISCLKLKEAMKVFEKGLKKYLEINHKTK